MKFVFSLFLRAWNFLWNYVEDLSCTSLPFSLPSNTIYTKFPLYTLINVQFLLMILFYFTALNLYWLSPFIFSWPITLTQLTPPVLIISTSLPLVTSARVWSNVKECQKVSVYYKVQQQQFVLLSCWNELHLSTWLYFK